MRILLLAMIAIGLTGLAGCHSGSSATAQSDAQMASGTPINKYCPINRGDEIDPNVTTVYKGKTVGFCCSDCIDIFNTDPEKYLAGLK